jgi:hypothetical protein
MGKNPEGVYMATLTDEEKAAAILGEEVEPTGDETSTEQANLDQEEEKPENVETPVEDESDEEKPHEEEAETEKPTESSFTKQFPNLKGETLEEYVPELETAYDNSFKEALRLSKELKDNAAIVEQAKQIVAQGAQSANPAAPVNPALSAIDEHPAIKYAKAKQTEDMISAFDDFKKDYPQATDAQAFEQFTKASDGISVALTSALGREPTYKELFPAIAGSLGWQRAVNEDRKNAAIKENASSSRVPSGQSAARPKPQKVSDSQVDAYLKMFTSKTREEAIKELSEVI